MSYIRIKETARIDYLNRRWRFERRQDHVIEWRSTDGTFEHITFTDAELQHLIARGELRLFDGHGRPPADPANVSRAHGQRGPSAADLEEADRKLVYVLAIHRAGLMRPDSCTQDWTRAIDEVWDEQARHWKRLRGAHAGEPVQKPCIKSVRNWVAQAGSPPNAGKLVSRHRHKGNYDDRVAPGAREIIDGLVQSTWMARPAISLTSFKDVVQGRIREYNAKAAARLAMPGLSAIRSSIAAFPADEVTKARHGEMAAFLKYGSAEAQADPEAPLDRVELDSTPADLFVMCSRTGLPLGRPTIVLCIDRCTRMVLGWFVTFEKPSILALMQCLRNAMLSKDYVAEMNETHGWNIRHPCETFGVPTELVLDRGAENVSGHVARFATRIGINRVHLMGGKKPWLKGCIERTIKTLSERLLHPARGTTFHNTLMRMDYDPAKDAVCTTDDLDWALHKYFIDIYPREERTSLGGARAIDVWRKLTRIHPVTSVGSIEEVDHLFGRTEEATPGRHGIRAFGMQYFSRELLELQRQPTFIKALSLAGGKLVFHADPSDIGQIVVRLPHQERTIVVPVAAKWREYATGLSLFAHRKIREFTRAEARAANDADELLTSKLELLEIMRGSMSKRGNIAGRQLLARMEGVARISRSGDRSVTAVAGSPASKPSPRAKPPRPSNDREDPSNAVAVRQLDLHSMRPSAGPARVKKGYRP